jgi:enoyl-CoA hydratase/carnithine racemase
MEYKTLILKEEDGIATIILNRPERRNAVNHEAEVELVSAIAEMSKAKKVRVLVVTGAGTVFCAGGDINDMVGSDQPSYLGKGIPEEIRQGLHQGLQKVVLEIQRLEKPTIAMVNGVAAGFGFDLACACDIRIGSETTGFVSSFIRLGLFPGPGGTWLMPRLMGIGRALQYLYTGDMITAEEAERMGLLNKLVPSTELEKETMALARRLAKGPPIALRLTKMQVYRGLELDLETALEMAAACETATLTSQDHKEGVAAFREKRAPVYKDK